MTYFYENGYYYLFVCILLQMFYIYIYFKKNINMILFENLQEINPMGLSSYSGGYLKTIINKHEICINIHNMEHTQNQGIHRIGLCDHWVESFTHI